MKKFSLSIKLFVFMFAFGFCANAQNIVKQADKQYDLYNFTKAIELYEQAFQQKENVYAAERLAAAYSLNKNYQQAEHWYAIALKLPGAKTENLLGYAKALQNNAKYAEAKAQYLNYAANEKTVPAQQLEVWTASCDSALSWIRKPKPIELKNEISLNTIGSDWAAVQNNGTIIFTSDRNIAKQASADNRHFLKFDGKKIPDSGVYGWTGHSYFRLYQKTGVQDSAKLLVIDDATRYHIGSASFTRDGKTMYFTMTKIPAELKHKRKSPVTINVEIYSSTQNGDGSWGKPVSFEYNKVNEYSLGDPFISADGQRLYFTSNMPGGRGGFDIYYSIKTLDGKWGKPNNLEQINTFGNDRSPVLDLNDNLFFASDGRVGMGGLDIFFTTKESYGFKSIANLGFPVNSPQDDFAFSLTGQGTLQYLSSNRIGGLGSDDIYSVVQKPTLILKLEGRVYDKKMNTPINDAVITLTNDKKSQTKILTDERGIYNFILDTTTNYRLIAKKSGFLASVQNVSTKGFTASTVLVKDIQLERIEVNKAIRLNNIYYDFDSSVILEAASIELDNLVSIMLDNPEIYIELGSHTDSRGKEAYNLNLSQKRAEAARLYIISKGIAAGRITAKGYGATRLINRCAKGVKCSDVEHQLNRRTEFKITKS